MGWGKEATRGHMGKHRVCSGDRGITKKAWPRVVIVFPAGKARQERLASLTNVSGLWAVRVVSGFQVLALS